MLGEQVVVYICSLRKPALIKLLYSAVMLPSTRTGTSNVIYRLYRSTDTTVWDSCCKNIFCFFNEADRLGNHFSLLNFLGFLQLSERESYAK